MVPEPVLQSVLPDRGEHRYFAKVKRKIIPKSGDILVAVLQSVLAKSGGKSRIFYHNCFC
jgi:hypothetical protein